MSTTPRTDAARVSAGEDVNAYVPTDFARTLERENNSLRNAQKACETCDGPTVERIKELERELAAERAAHTETARLLFETTAEEDLIRIKKEQP